MIDKVLESYGNSMNGSVIRKAVDEVFNIDLKAVSDKGEGKRAHVYSPEIMRGIREILHKDASPETDRWIMCLPKVEAMDFYLEYLGSEVTSKDVLHIINQIYGINLEGLSSLNKIRVSLFSKGKWMTRKDDHLIIVNTGLGDVEVKIYPTDYFKERTGKNHIPEPLKERLSSLGYYFHQEYQAYYYANPSGETVSDHFKNQTMGAIGEVVEKWYKDL